MNIPAAILLDTNVWLDHYLGWRKGSQAARNLIEKALELGVTLLYAVSSIKDVYYLVASELKRLERQESGGELSESGALAAEAAAWGCVNNLQVIACVVPLDLPDVWMASKQRALHRDFEDDLLIAASLRSKADYLVTNDEKLLRHCPVAALDVTDMLALLEVL